MNYLSDFELLLLIVCCLAVGLLGGLILSLWLNYRTARLAHRPPVVRVRHDVHHHGLPAEDDVPGDEWKHPGRN